MDFFSNISPSIVLAFGTGLEVSAAVNCHIVLKKSKTAVLFTFFSLFI